MEPDLEQRLNLNPTELSELQSIVYSLLLNSVVHPSFLPPPRPPPTTTTAIFSSASPLSHSSFISDISLSNQESLVKPIPRSVEIPRPFLSKPPFPKLKWYQRVDSILNSKKVKSGNGEKIGYLSTGDDGINQLLGGGISIGFPGNITEVVGSSGTGKTQFVLQLCLMVQLPMELGGLDGGKRKKNYKNICCDNH